MTTEAPPQSDTLVLAAAINRLAQSFEQLVLTRLDEPQNGHPLNATQKFVEPEGTQFAMVDDLPPQRVAPLAQCPVHHQDWKYIPAGVSKKSGKAYDAFYACPVTGCTQRPPA